MKAAQLPHLDDTVRMPYFAWRVASLVDGVRTSADIAKEMGVPAVQVEQVLNAIWMALKGAPMVQGTPVQEGELRQMRGALLDCIGPMADLMVDDVLDEFSDQGKQPSRQEFVEALISTVPDAAARGRFVQMLTERGLL